MKAYGHSRRDKIECKYGCCTTKSGPKKNCRAVVDKSNVKQLVRLLSKKLGVLLKKSKEE